MKKNLQIIRNTFLLLWVVLTIYSCKKDQTFTKINPVADETATKIQEWLAKQKTDSIEVPTINNLLKDANWKTAHTFTADSNKVYEIVTLLDNSVFNDPAKTEQRYLVLQMNSTVITGFIYKLYGNKTDLSGMVDAAIGNFNNKNITGFSGEVTLSTWNNRVQKIKDFENGSMNKYAVLQPRKSTRGQIQSLKTNTYTCIDWYWCTYSDDVLIGEEYLYTICGDDDGNCYPNALRNSKGVQTIKTNCNGGGGSGPSDPIVTTDIMISVNDPGFDDAGDGGEGYTGLSFTTTRYEYPAEIASRQSTGEVISCQMGDVLAYPANETVIFPNGATSTRNVTVLTSSKNWESLAPHTITLSWAAISYSNVRYSYRSSITRTQNVDHTETKSF